MTPWPAPVSLASDSQRLSAAPPTRQEPDRRRSGDGAAEARPPCRDPGEVSPVAAPGCLLAGFAAGSGPARTRNTHGCLAGPRRAARCVRSLADDRRGTRPRAGTARWRRCGVPCRAFWRGACWSRRARRHHPADAAADTWRGWNPAAGFFHQATRDVPYWPAREGLRVPVGQSRANPRRLRSRGRTATGEAARDPAAASGVGRRRRPAECPCGCTPGSPRTWRRFGADGCRSPRRPRSSGLTLGVQSWVIVRGFGRMPLKTAPSGGARHSIEAFVAHAASARRRVRASITMPRRRMRSSVASAVCPRRGLGAVLPATGVDAARFARRLHGRRVRPRAVAVSVRPRLSDRCSPNAGITRSRSACWRRRSASRRSARWPSRHARRARARPRRARGPPSCMRLESGPRPRGQTWAPWPHTRRTPRRESTLLGGHHASRDDRRVFRPPCVPRSASCATAISSRSTCGDADQEAAEIHRRVIAAGGPALLFTNVRGAGSRSSRTCSGRRAAPSSPLAVAPSSHRTPRALAETMLPPTQASCGRHEMSRRSCLRVGLSAGAAPDPSPTSWTIRRRSIGFPILTTWPDDGGPFITLPLVYTEHPERSGPQPRDVSAARLRRSRPRDALADWERAEASITPRPKRAEPRCR